jgi:hypothetical protein
MDIFISRLPIVFLPGEKFRHIEVCWARQAVAENGSFSFVVFDSEVKIRPDHPHI